VRFNSLLCGRPHWGASPASPAENGR